MEPVVPSGVSGTAVCHHCGDPCRDDTVTDGVHAFCCSGCKSVFQILQSHDMCEYYDLDSRAGVSMKGIGGDEYAVLDDVEIERQFVEFEGNGIRRLRFETPTMHCASCVWLLEQLDRLDTGIVRSQVDLMRKLVRVDIDPARTSSRAVAGLLASIGYRPLIRPEGARGTSAATRSVYLRLGVAGFAAGNVMMFSIARYFAGPDGMATSLVTLFDVLSIALSVPVLLYGASPWWRSAWGALRQRTINLDVPVALGILVLFVRSVADILLGQSEGFLDSFTGLVFFLLIGRLFQQKAFDAVSFDRTYRSFFPLSVRVLRKGIESTIRVDNVRVGDTVIVRNQEVIPCDAVLLSNAGYVDYSFVTGEQMPVECVEGGTVYAGGKVVGRRLRMTVTKP
ncbi:MAG: heavy metal translocating P-type ATPase, partial [Candidatus Kapabacteria bacterium]|nr:heavy metal translocating P-type ATPase [Candidatus Kapabacteria bacterium]